MIALIVMHVSFEGPAHIEDYLISRGWTVDRRLISESPLPADPGTWDLLVLMGGPMSVHDVAEYPWLVGEKNFLRTWLSTEKPVLGVCLGAQLLAEALGAAVMPNPEKEIGWFPLQWLEEDGETVREEEIAFHWHGETFTLPPGAVRIAKSRACANQGFRHGKVLALQFHLEVTPQTAALMADYGAKELTPGRYIQDRQRLLDGAQRHCDIVNGRLDRTLSTLIGLIQG